jgi:hypothetical protein
MKILVERMGDPASAFEVDGEQLLNLLSKDKKIKEELIKIIYTTDNLCELARATEELIRRCGFPVLMLSSMEDVVYLLAKLEPHLFVLTNKRVCTGDIAKAVSYSNKKFYELGGVAKYRELEEKKGND